MKGCFDKTEEECYPLGYIKDNKVCFKKHYSKNIYSFVFINQSKSGENCTYDFECESNFCFNKKCVGDIKSLIVDIIQKVSLFENRINLLEIGLEKLGESSHKEHIINKTEEIKESPGGITGFFARIFN